MFFNASTDSEEMISTTVLEDKHKDATGEAQKQKYHFHSFCKMFRGKGEMFQSANIYYIITDIKALIFRLKYANEAKSN